MAKKIKRRLAAISQRRELLGYIQNHLHTNIHAQVLTSVAGFLFAVSATDLSVLFFLFTIVYGVW